MTPIRTGIMAVAMSVAATAGLAQDYPSQPITIVNPYSAGGPADLISRTIAEGMAERLGQPVVVENRPGAGTAIAATYVAQADPDGYTLLIAGSPTHVITPALQEVEYDGVESFTPVSMVANVPNVLVVASSTGITTIEQLIERAGEAPDTLSFASVGNGSLPHLSSVLFMQETETQMVHIPYGGAAPAVVDLLAGNVDMGFLNAPPLIPHVESGDLVALGVAASDRSDQLPDVPTMQELGLGEFQMSTWYGISAPAGTPDDVVAALDEAISATLEDEAIRSSLSERGVMIFYKTSQDFADFLAGDSGRMLDLLDAAGVSGDQ
ncbi:tripartite tricarboxylate transporter substrate binding protein [Rhodobacterales bacterium HKCCE2091]|nr:tripartite tricarboxylate transporter substrate binding protein [Rhodobacterales bacterium HKCCE2091]